MSGFAPATGCFDCLRTRVASHDPETTERPSADRSTARLAGALAGRECVRVLSGDERSVIGHIVELPHRRRRLLPVPGCRCADEDRDRTLEYDDESLSLDVAVERVEATIDDRMGIVASIGEVESFPAPYYLATNAETEGFSDASAPKQAAGVADDWNAALMKAVGEGLERYCAGVYRDDEFVHASETDLENPVSPTELVRPDDAPSYDPTVERRWVDGENLATGDPAQLPAAAVQFPSPASGSSPRSRPDSASARRPSTPCCRADGSDRARCHHARVVLDVRLARTHGRRRAIRDPRAPRRKRGTRGDAAARHAGRRRSVVAVAVHRDSASVPEAGVETTDDAWPAFAAGSAADLDATAAATAALEEALQNWMELRNLGPDDAAEASGEIGEYASYPAREFVDVDRTVPAESVGPTDVPAGTDALESVVDRLEDVGLVPYAARVTTRDVEAIGFEAVRVVVPGAQPLFTGTPFSASEPDGPRGPRVRGAPRAAVSSLP